MEIKEIKKKHLLKKIKLNGQAIYNRYWIDYPDNFWIRILNLSLIYKIPQHTIWYDNILILRSNTKTKSEEKNLNVFTYVIEWRKKRHLELI